MDPSKSYSNYCRFRLTVPSNPNVVLPGVDWQISATAAPGSYWRNTANYPQCNRAGYYRITGQLILNAGTIHDALLIRLGLVGRAYRTPCGMTSGATRNGAPIAGTFMEVVQYAVGDSLAVNAYRGSSGTGTDTSYTVGGVELSYVDMVLLEPV